MDAALSLAQPLDALIAGGAAKPLPTGNKAKAKAAAEDFEAVYLNSMFQNMFTGIDGEGPFGGDGATGVWRSFLTDAYAKSFAKAGGIGIADQVYRSLIHQQEISNEHVGRRG
jgi:Rod binding domain-containing protein